MKSKILVGGIMIALFLCVLLIGCGEENTNPVVTKVAPESEELVYVDDTSASLAPTAWTQYKRWLAVSYARTFAISGNPMYRNYYYQGGDCTNFLSQALLCGYWPQIGGLKWSTGAWCYNDYTETWTWSRASKWCEFTKKRSRGFLVSKPQYLYPGDVVQMGEPPYHSMMVTKKVGNEIYLTYRSAYPMQNKVDEPFSNIRNKYKNEKFHFWRLYDYIQ